MLGAGGRHRGDEGGGSNALGPSWEGVTGMSGEGGGERLAAFEPGQRNGEKQGSGAAHAKGRREGGSGSTHDAWRGGGGSGRPPWRGHSGGKRRSSDARAGEERVEGPRARGTA
jgi:hypothetical protein